MDTMRLLFEGKRSAADVVDDDLVAFLRYYVSNAQICFNNICNASGCLNVASKTCSWCLFGLEWGLVVPYLGPIAHKLAPQEKSKANTSDS